MDWQQQLNEVVQSSSLQPTFEQWLDATGYREYMHKIRAGSINVQATAMSALFDYYQSEMRGRFKPS